MYVEFSVLGHYCAQCISTETVVVSLSLNNGATIVKVRHLLASSKVEIVSLVGNLSACT